MDAKKCDLCSKYYDGQITSSCVIDGDINQLFPIGIPFPPGRLDFCEACSESLREVIKAWWDEQHALLQKHSEFD